VTFTKGRNHTQAPAEPVTPARGRLFKVRPAAQYLGAKESFVRSLVARGELVAVRTTAGRLIGIYEADCEAWMAAHRSAAEPIPSRPSVDERIQHLLPADRRFA